MFNYVTAVNKSLWMNKQQHMMYSVMQMRSMFMCLTVCYFSSCIVWKMCNNLHGIHITNQNNASSFATESVCLCNTHL